MAAYGLVATLLISALCVLSDRDVDGDDVVEDVVVAAVSKSRARSSRRLGARGSLDVDKASFLPPPSQQLLSADADEFADAAAAAFARHVANASCRRERPTTLCPRGVGSTLSSALKPMTDNFRHGLPTHLGGPEGFNFSLVDVGLIDTASLGAIDVEPRPREMPRSTRLPSCPAYDCNGIHKLRDSVPQEFQHLGLFWWTAQRLRWLLRPAPDGQLGRSLAKEKQRLMWESRRPILGLHVRHGDACIKAQQLKKKRRCDGLDVYMESIKKLAPYGYRSVYLATDDPAVIQEAKRSLSGNFTLLVGAPSQAQDRSSKNETQLFDDLMYKVNLAREYREVLLDIMLLADTDGFVGKFTSNIFRLAYALNFGMRRCATPYISLDSFWCFSYGELKGQTLEGQPFRC
eukprot:TRINITY_DN24360_c0_g1_i4.p1 TRINITY_DN24360_c0_g1~~TRINITY_DN24360_c0_g1_i4.p1  ORF type:complete len:419 (+),score=69.42 TRINITY_DN24360_c0_g1_i4:47-1258(+)